MKSLSYCVFVLGVLCCVPAWWQLRSTQWHPLPMDRIHALQAPQSLHEGEDDVMLRHTSFRVLLTVVNGAADDGVRLRWSHSLSHTVQDGLAPLLRSISFVGKFSVDTQQVHYWDFHPTTHPMDGAFQSKVLAQSWVREDAGSDPSQSTVSLVVLVPPEKETPLLTSTQSPSFWLPEVGAVVVDNSLFWKGNSTTSHTSTMRVVDLPHRVLEEALHVLRPLLLRVLGLPEPVIPSTLVVTRVFPQSPLLLLFTVNIFMCMWYLIIYAYMFETVSVVCSPT